MPRSAATRRPLRSVFERRYSDEEQPESVVAALPEASSVRGVRVKYCEIRGRQLLQCRQCRYQTSLSPALSCRHQAADAVWFCAMHLLAQAKRTVQHRVGRRLGISTNAAWRVQHKPMQAMIERNRCHKLALPATDRDLRRLYRGERTGQGSGAVCAATSPLSWRSKLPPIYGLYMPVCKGP